MKFGTAFAKSIHGRRNWTSLLACALIAAPVQAEPAAPPTDTDEDSIYQRIELGFKLCSNHVLGRGHLSDEHAGFLAEMDVYLVDDVPGAVAANSMPLFPRDRIYARLQGADGNVFIATAANHFACRVVVADTKDALRHRVRFVDNLRQIPSWTYDQRRSGVRNGMLREELTTAGGLMIAIMNGPNVVKDEGRGVQAFLTVAMIPRAAGATR